MKEDFTDILIGYVVPVIIIIWIIWAGTFINLLFGVPTILDIIGTTITVAGFLVYYFRSEIRQFMGKS